MFSTEPVGHGERLAGLWRAAAEGRLAHALLFKGPDGVGKFVSLGWLASGLLCADGPGSPCGTCGPCKRVRSGNHPDLFIVDSAAEGEDQITIHFVAHREDRPQAAYQGPAIEDFLALRSLEGGWRVVLVRAAERMNEAAQNALLKTLEEPRPGTLLALETAQPERLLPTVQSRVVTVELEPLDPSDTLAVLADNGVPEDEAEALARWSRGAPGRALSGRALGISELRAVLGEVIAGELGPAAAAAAVWRVAGEFQGKTPAAAGRHRAAVLLDLGLEVLLDLERAAAGLPLAELVHGDLLEGLPAARECSAARRRAQMEEWLSLRQDVMLNLPPEGLVDRALRALQGQRAEANKVRT